MAIHNLDSNLINKTRRSLVINDTKITDISFLKSMTQLEYLTLSNVGLVDIEIIGELKNLDYLDISNNKIKDISSLSKLSKLVTIDISNNNIEDITPLTQCPLSGRIDLRKNPIKQIPKGIFNWDWDCITPVYCNKAFQSSRPILVDFEHLIHPMPISGINISRREMSSFMAIKHTLFPDDK